MYTIVYSHCRYLLPEYWPRYTGLLSHVYAISPPYITGPTYQQYSGV